MDKKIIKETTGHSPNVVDKYASTGMDQRREVSKVIQGKNDETCQKNEAKVGKDAKEKQSERSVPSKIWCGHGNINQHNIVQIIQKIVQANTKKGKTVINLKMEFYGK